MKKSYLGAQPAPRTLVNCTLTISARQAFRNPFSKDDSKVYMSLGDKIRLAAETGESVGIEVSPQYDGNDADDLNVMSSFHHDIFDIAEQYGKMVDSSSASDNPQTIADLSKETDKTE